MLRRVVVLAVSMTAFVPLKKLKLFDRPNKLLKNPFDYSLQNGLGTMEVTQARTGYNYGEKGCMSGNSEEVRGLQQTCCNDLA